MTPLRMSLALILLLAPTLRAAEAPPKPALPALPTSHTARQIEGWTVRVDDRLPAAPQAIPIDAPDVPPALSRHEVHEQPLHEPPLEPLRRELPARLVAVAERGVDLHERPQHASALVGVEADRTRGDVDRRHLRHAPGGARGAARPSSIATASVMCAGSSD